MEKAIELKIIPRADYQEWFQLVPGEKSSEECSIDSFELLAVTEAGLAINLLGTDQLI